MPEQFLNPKELKGLALPSVRNNGGYFASKGKYDVAWGDVMLTLFTPIGSRPGRRNFGSALIKVLFDPAVSEQTERVRHIITESLIEWCTHIRVRDVQVTIDMKEIRVGVTFSLVTDSQKATRFITLKRSEGGAQVYEARVA